MPNISNILSSSQIALEKVTADKFGAVVEDFARIATGGPKAAPVANTRRPHDPTTWFASSYAAALAGATSYRPKLKFLFKVEFRFKPGVIQSLLEGSLITSAMADSINRNEFTFMIKTVDRPKVDFEYEDEVNMYNFRTKVLKKIRHRELTVTFMDDTGNRVFDFFRILMMLYSPITRRQMTREGQTHAPDSNTAGGANGNGMSFTSPSMAFSDTAHRGVINSNVGQALEVIRVKQMFVDPSEPYAGNATREVIFDFMNPRLVSFDLDDLSHELSDPNILTMQFDYDWMEMVKIDHLEAADTPIYNITVKNVTNAPVDILNGKNPPVGDAINPFGAIIARQAARAAQQVTLDTVNRAVTTTFGTGRFATNIGGRISGALGGVVSGIVGAASRSLIGGLGSSPSALTARASAPVVSDNATATGDSATIKQSSTAYQAETPAVGGGI